MQRTTRGARRTTADTAGVVERSPPLRSGSSPARPRGAAHAPGVILGHRADVLSTRSTLAAPILQA